MFNGVVKSFLSRDGRARNISVQSSALSIKSLSQEDYGENFDRQLYFAHSIEETEIRLQNSFSSFKRWCRLSLVAS